jgi:hypothetical protein
VIGGKLKLRTRRPTAVTTQQSHDYTAKYHVLFGTGQSGPKFWQLLSVSLHERCSVVSRFNHSSDLNNSISDSRSISQNQKRADELDDLKASIRIHNHHVLVLHQSASSNSHGKSSSFTSANKKNSETFPLPASSYLDGGLDCSSQVRSNSLNPASCSG